MAKTVTAQGSITGDSFQILLDGIGTYDQNERLLSKMDALLKRFKATEDDSAKLAKARREEIEQIEELTDSLEKNNDEFRRLQLMSGLLQGDFKSLSRNLDYNNKSLVLLGAASAGIYTMIGALTAYSEQLGLAIQRGIAGDIFDFAIAAKTAGLNFAQFNKALTESDGSFVALGGGATESAKRFGQLIGSVREATASVGNFGLNNEQLANFTAQQLKIAVSQGFKGNQAQAAVIESSRNVGTSFIELAEATGRTVTEMITAATKISTDPVVSSFVRGAGAAGMAISQEVQKLAGDFRGIFGEAGDKIAQDLIKSTVGNLPFQVTQSGKSIVLASGLVFEEMQRQALMARNGIQRTEADQQRLRDIVLKETETRGEELRMLAGLGGATGDAANQILAMAQAAQQMNTAEGKEANRRSENARKFNHAVNELQASLQEAMIPFLQVLSTINFTAMFETLSAFAQGLRVLLFPLELLGNVIGSETVAGTIVGGMLALAAVILPLIMVYKNLQMVFPNAMDKATRSAINFANKLNERSGNYGRRAGEYVKGIPGRYAEAGRISKLGQGAMAGAGIASLMINPNENLATNVGSSVGSIAGGIAGGALAGRFVGGLLGSFLGPIGAVAGSVVGGMLGDAVGQWIGSSDELPNAAASAIDDTKSKNSNNDVVGAIKDLNSTMQASIGVQARGVAVASDSNRYLRDQSIYAG
jgi:hypothetical protein